MLSEDLESSLSSSSASRTRSIRTRDVSAALRGNFLAAPGYLLKPYFSPTEEGILNIHS